MKLEGIVQVHLPPSVDDEVRAHKLQEARWKDFSTAWWDAGRPIYELSHTIAAALTATRAPTMPWSHCPYPAFIVSVPIEYLSIDHIVGVSGSRVWIAVATTPVFRYVGLLTVARDTAGRRVCKEVDYVEARGWFKTDDNVFSEGMPRKLLLENHNSKLSVWMKLALRLATNIVAYVTTYRECLSQKSKSSGAREDVRVIDVGLPKTVSIDREFREYVKQLVAARTVPHARGVLAHMVRGHWKHTPARKLIWIAPYHRGDENIGRVVSLMEHL